MPSVLDTHLIISIGTVLDDTFRSSNSYHRAAMRSLPPLITILSPLLASWLIGLLGRTLGERTARISIWALAISGAAAIQTLYDVLQHDATVLKFSRLP